MKLIRCDVCGEYLNGFTSWSSHRKKKHPKTQRPDSNLKFCCTCMDYPNCNHEQAIKEKAELLKSTNESQISICRNCYSITHTKRGTIYKCGKCGKDRRRGR